MNEWIIDEECLSKTDNEVLIGYDHFRCSECSQKLNDIAKTIILPVCNESVRYVYPTSYNYRNYYSAGLNYVKNIEIERS